jgi:hypothetical protein
VRCDLQAQFQLAQCSSLRGVGEQRGPTRRCSRSASHSAELEALGREKRHIVLVEQFWANRRRHHALSELVAAASFVGSVMRVGVALHIEAR